jgi:lipopolysaccharide transport system permease protein
MPEITDSTITAEQFRLRIDCSIAGKATMGCHWLDPDSGRFLRESPWVEADGSARFEFELPPAPGRYRFYVSPRLDGSWGYLRGQEFLAIDATVDEAGVRVDRKLMTTVGQMRRERWPATMAEILLGPWKSYAANRHLILSMVRRDIVSRYRGSFADAFWALLNPLLLMLTYYFVFGVFLKTRFPGDPSQSGFVLFFLSGMLPWLAMNESIARAPNSALEHRNLITKVIFPVEVLPLNLTLAGLVTGLTATVIFLFFLVASRGGVPLTALWLPVIWVPQILLTAGLCYLLAAVGVYVRDLVYVMGLLLTMWFFLTPICYPDTALPEVLLPILGKNPLYILVRAYRAIFIESASPNWPAIAKLYALSVVIFYAGFAVFRRARRSFADVL